MTTTTPTIKIAAAYARETDVTRGHDPDGIPIAVRNGWTVYAETERGDRWMYWANGRIDHASAVELAQAVEAEGAIHPVLWITVGPAYGSRAWVEDGHEDIAIALEREELEWNG